MRNTYSETDSSDPDDETPSPLLSHGREAHTPNARMATPPSSEGNANDQGDCKLGSVAGDALDLASKGLLGQKGEKAKAKRASGNGR